MKTQEILNEAIPEFTFHELDNIKDAMWYWINNGLDLDEDRSQEELDIAYAASESAWAKLEKEHRRKAVAYKRQQGKEGTVR